MQRAHSFQVKTSKRAEDDDGCMTWDLDMRIFGAWTPLSGIRTDTCSYVTGPNYRDKIIKINDVKSLAKCGGWFEVRSVREMPKSENGRDKGSPTGRPTPSD